MHEVTLTVVIKSAVLLAIFSTQGIYVSLVVLLAYRYVVALALGVTVMPLMDMGTFFSLRKAPLNIMASVTFTKGTTTEKLFAAYGQVVPNHYKMKSKVRVVLGDYYYEKLDESNEQILENQMKVLPKGTLKTWGDVEKFMAKELGTEMPLDRPQWRVWL